MRSSFFLLLTIVITTIVPASACDVGFNTDVSESVTLPLAVAGACDASRERGAAIEGTLPRDGEPDKNGNLTTFTVTTDGSRCVLHAFWQGVLIDTNVARAKAEADMRDAGIDPRDVDVHISRIDPKVTAVDLDGDAAVGADGVSYRAVIGVPRAPEIFVMEVAPGGDVAHPEVVVNENKRLLRAANDAWRDEVPMPAVGTVDLVIDEAGSNGNAALPRALRVDFDVALEGAVRTMVQWPPPAWDDK